MNKNTSLAIVLAVLASTGAAFAYTGQEYAPDAKVTLNQARATALNTRHGTITNQELERERGGSGLRYSFDIKAHGHTYEVGIDAKTGHILENALEGAHPD